MKQWQWAYEQAGNKQNSCVASVIHNQTSKQSPKQQEKKMKNSGSEDETRDTQWTYLRAPLKQRLLDFSMLLLHGSCPPWESFLSKKKTSPLKIHILPAESSSSPLTHPLTQNILCILTTTPCQAVSFATCLLQPTPLQRLSLNLHSAPLQKHAPKRWGKRPHKRSKKG